MNEKKDIKKLEKKKGYFFSMSKFEQIFWASIAIFMLVYIGFITMAKINTPKIVDENLKEIQKPIISQWITKLVPSDKMKENIGNNLDSIHKNLDEEKEKILKSIDTEIDSLFSGVENNVDSFLDVHYSVIGEYAELGAMATGEISESIKEQLFGSNFSKEVKEKSLNIDNIYIHGIKEHFNVIENIATNDVDINLNSNLIKKLKHDVEVNISTQSTKIGTILSLKFAPKVVQVISAKLAAKTIAKIATKSVAKVSTKGAVSSGAAAAGLTCGPLAWLCSPIAAGVAWFGTDAIIVSGDEYFNREEFKQEILVSLREQRKFLKKNYKEAYMKEFSKLSVKVQEKYKSANIKRKIRIKDMI
jgi:ribosomal protein L7Ae-like RNA K-turn-binding protein